MSITFARDVDEDQAAPGLAARHAEGARHTGRRGAAARGGEQEGQGSEAHDQTVATAQALIKLPSGVQQQAHRAHEVAAA